MFILSSTFGGLEFWSVDHTSILENSELKVFKNLKCLGEISNNWPNDLFATNYTGVLNRIDNHCWQYYNKVELL